MRVIVRGKWCDGQKEMIVLVLTKEDKKNISEMGEGQNIYVQLKDPESLKLVEEISLIVEKEEKNAKDWNSNFYWFDDDSTVYRI